MIDTNARRDAIESRWTSLARDWQAVLLGFGLLVVVHLGVRIPW